MGEKSQNVKRMAACYSKQIKKRDFYFDVFQNEKIKEKYKTGSYSVFTVYFLFFYNRMQFKRHVAGFDCGRCTLYGAKKKKLFHLSMV